MNKKRGRKPDLHFSPSGTLEGFTTAGVQGFSELNPVAVIRELIQNSLDAVREDGRSRAIVRFELEERLLAEVPAIDTYKSAVKKSVRDQGKLQSSGKLHDQAQGVVDAITGCLDEKRICVFSILDNGMGLDKQRMVGLLADGMSVKSSSGSGAIGNGHLTAIPASDLRYVLYGGVCADGEKIASGHAILASFSEKSVSMGKDGYYALSVGKSLHNRYVFPDAMQMAALIKEKLDWIEGNFSSGRGAAVVIPGFNRFREGGDLWEIIEKAAACNFFAAIAAGDLEIVYRDGDGEERKLNKSGMGRVFAGDIASEKRAKSFLSGSRAAEAYRTAVEGKSCRVDVGCGSVEVVLRDVHEGKSRIDLCRNGMWISDKLPRLNLNKFSEQKPFHCLIRVTSRDGEIHRLIRKSEGPLHNHIEAKKWLKPSELARLEQAFKKIGDFLLENVEELAKEEFFADGVLIIDTGSVDKWQKLRPHRPRVFAGGGGIEKPANGSGYGGKPNGFRRSGRAVPFGAIAVPTGARSYSVELHPQVELKGGIEAEIRFVLDENIDETCDASSDEQFVRLREGSVKMDGVAVVDGDLTRNEEDEILGVCLGRFKPGEVHRLDFDYDLPDGVAMQATDMVSLRAEIVQRRRQTQR